MAGNDAPIPRDFGCENCARRAIAAAVTEYGRERNQSTLDEEVARDSERLGFLAHELRNLVNVAIIAFEELKTGNVGVAGSSAALNRSLMGLRGLISSSLAEVRLSHGIQNREQFLVSGFIDELAPAATLEANAKGITLTVMPIEDEVVIEGDRLVLAAVLRNLLQNAFKFTRPRSTVTLRTGASVERVVIEVRTSAAVFRVGPTPTVSRRFDQRTPIEPVCGLACLLPMGSGSEQWTDVMAQTCSERAAHLPSNMPRILVPAVAML